MEKVLGNVADSTHVFYPVTQYRSGLSGFWDLSRKMLGRYTRANLASFLTNPQLTGNHDLNIPYKTNAVGKVLKIINQEIITGTRLL
jgi:hypothetical protein